MPWKRLRERIRLLNWLRAARRQLTSTAVSSALILSLVVPAVFAPPASAAVCSAASNQNVDFLDRPADLQNTARPFYVDNGLAGVKSAYVGYGFSGSAFTSVADLWMKVTGYSASSGSALLSTASGQSTEVPVRIASQVTANKRLAYFYVTASGVAQNKAQTISFAVYNGQPSLGGTELCTFSEEYTEVSDTLSASANKVTSLTVSTNSPALGSEFVVTTTGATGTVGTADNYSNLRGTISLSPSQSNSWPADAFTLTGIEFKLGNTTYYDRLRYWPSSSANQLYTLKYKFVARKKTNSTTEIKPVANIASGSNQVKYTGSYSGTAAGAVIQPVTQQASVNKSITSVSAATVVGNNSQYTVGYKVTLTNRANSQLVADSFVDTVTLNSGGATGGAFVTPTAVLGQTITGQLGGSAISGDVEEVVSSSQIKIHFAGPITVNANSSVDLTYSISFQYPTANASMPIGNSIVANIGPDTVNSQTGYNALTADIKQTVTLTLTAGADGTLATDLTPDSRAVDGGASGSGACTTVGANTSVVCTFVKGLVVDVTATPGAGKTLKSWTTSGGSFNCPAGALDCVVSLTANSTVEAVYDTSYVVTVTGVSNGVVSDGTFVAFSCAAGSCTKSYASGATPSITVTANSGYRLTALEQTTPAAATCTLNSGTCALTVGSAITISATVVALYGLEVTVNYKGQVAGTSPFVTLVCTDTTGTAPCTGSATYEAGTSVTLTASATDAANYPFKAWAGKCTGSNATCTFTMDASYTVSASFSGAVLSGATTTTPSGQTGGSMAVTTVNANNAPESLLDGCSDSSQPNCSDLFAINDSITLTATAASGYAIGAWTLPNGVSATSGCTSGSSTCRFTITSAMTVSVNFTKLYTLTYTAQAGKGSITGTASQSVAHGANGSQVTASANAGYVFVDWSDSVATAVRTDSNISADLTVEARFKQTQTITFAQPANVTDGSSTAAVTATADSGLGVTLTSNSASVCTVNAQPDVNNAGAATINILKPGTCSLTAAQAGNGTYAAATSVTRTFTVSGVNLTITFAGSGAGTVAGDLFAISCSATCTTSVLPNSTITLTPTANAATSDFISWSGDGTTTAPATTRVINMGTSAKSTTVTFDLKVGVQAATYTVTYDGNGSNDDTAAPTDGTAYAQNAQVTVLAKPNGLVKSGHSFSSWTTQQGGGGASYVANDTFNIGANVTLWAQWTIDTYTITYAAGTNGSGNNQTATKTYNVNLTLANSNTANGWFTRNGYTLTGWTTTDGTAQTNALNSAFATNAATTFYPVWTSNSTFSVTYDGNNSDGGAVPTDNTPYNNGDNVTVLGNTGSLTRSGYSFGGWNTLANGNGTTYSANTTFVISADTPLFAVWNANAPAGGGGGYVAPQPQPTEFTLYVSVTGQGVASPATTTFAVNTPVVVAAQPKSGWKFSRWSGDCLGTTPQCSVTMTADKYVTAIFVQDEVSSTIVTYPLAVSVIGLGIVQVVPGQVGPGYVKGTNLRLTPEAREGWTFQSWSGACAGAAFFCSVSMDDAKTVGAVFTATSAPDQVNEAWMQPQADGTSLISWTAASGATQYIVRLAGRNIATCSASATSCTVNRLVGPSDVVTVVARNTAAAADQSPPAEFVAPTNRLRLFTVNFDSGSSQLTDRAKTALRTAIQRMRTLGYTTLSIVGHADNREGKAADLSLARAKAVARFVGNALRIDFVTSGRGATAPMTTNSTIVGRAANRRAVGSVG